MDNWIKNFSGINIKEWLISNILWMLLYFIIIFIFFKFLPRVVEAIKTTIRILKDNRNTRGTGLGKYLADRFIDIWYSNEEKLPLPYVAGKFYGKTFNNNSNSCWHTDFMDKQLVNWNLIEISDNKVVKPKRNWRNNLIVKMTKFYLIHFIGDNPQYYKDMEKQSEK